MQICTVLNSRSPSNNASKCSRKLCYGKIGFIVFVPGSSVSAGNIGGGWLLEAHSLRRARKSENILKLFLLSRRVQRKIPI